MADVVFWQSDGYLNAMGPTFYDAVEMKKLGVDVAIFLQGEAIVAVAERKMQWSPLLTKYAKTLEANMKTMGFSSNPDDYLKMCHDAGVPVYGSGGWSDLLGIRFKLPSLVKVLEIPEAEKLMAEAKNIIGGP